jgi:hypothetical protein
LSKVAISGAATGTATFTIESPATNTNRTITLPDATGTIVASGTTPSLNGITFPATQVASADANTLDDYEEGTWTPVLTSQGGTLTSYVATYGTYVKIGRKVLAECKIDSIVVGTATGGGFIAGWPFNAANVTTGAAASDDTGTAQAFTLGTGGSGVVSKFDGTTPFAGSQNIIVQVNYDI